MSIKNMIRGNIIIKDKNHLKSILIFAVFSLLLILIGIRSYQGKKLTIQVGEIATEDIRATKTIQDEHATEQLRIEVENNVVPKYRISPLIQMRINDNVEMFMDSVRDIKSRDDLTNYGKARKLEELSNISLDSELYSVPIAMEYRELSSFESLLKDLFSQTMGQGIREEELEYEKNNLAQIINSLEYNDDVKRLGIAILEELIQPNEFIDEEETRRRIDAALESIQPVVINPNEIIVRQGSVITANAYELIKASGLIEGEENTYAFYLGYTILIAIGVSFFALYIKKFIPNILNDNRIIATLLILLLTIIICFIFDIFSSFLIPISLSTILIAILIDVKLAIITNLLVTGFVALMLGLEAPLVTMYMISSNLAILINFKANQRYGVLIIGLLVAIFNFLVLGAFEFIHPDNIVEFFKAGGLVFLNGIIAGILALGSLPIWENVFSILTPLKLLEITNPNQPLLKRLLLEAPGTYHHSIMVGNLSEAAANEIDADPYLAKAGATYHDIGKVVNPYYFKENQFDIPNPHDLIEPKESAKIITSHTEMGKKLALSKRIPKEIIDIIEQHHGDTPVQYFYFKAKEKDENVTIEDFRYRGRKPQTKEAAIVMLADSTEAAVRSLKNPTKENIDDMVEKVVNGKLKDGQLEECNITYRDIQKIIEIFKSTLVAISHERIRYPVLEEEEV